MSTVAKAIILWSAIIPFAILNGLLRDYCLAKFLNPPAARTTSGIVLALIIVAFSVATIGWLPRSPMRVYIGVGGLWLALTIAFEFLFGHFVAKRSWADLLRPYRFENGDIWPLVLVVVALAPLLGALLRDRS
jgi:hypothetical protein